MRGRQLKYGENVVILTNGVEYWKRIELYPYDKLKGRVMGNPSSAAEYVYVSLDPKSTRALRSYYPQFRSEGIVIPKFVVFPDEGVSEIMEVE